jgi:hypothetical protein
VHYRCGRFRTERTEKELWVDLSKLNTSDWLVSGGAIVFLISLFLPWYGIDDQFGSFANNGSDYFLTGWLPMLLIIAVFVFTVLPKLAEGVNLPEVIGPVPRLQAALIAAGAAAVLVLLRLIIASDNVGSIDVDVDLDRKYGLFLALLAAIAVAAGAFLKNQAEEDAGSSSSSAPPTPF